MAKLAILWIWGHCKKVEQHYENNDYIILLIINHFALISFSKFEWNKKDSIVIEILHIQTFCHQISLNYKGSRL